MDITDKSELSGCFETVNSNLGESLKCNLCDSEKVFKNFSAIVSHWRNSKSCSLPKEYQSPEERFENILPEGTENLNDVENYIDSSYCYVYCIRGEGKFYVGQSIELKTRLKTHTSGSGHTVPIEFEELDRIEAVESRDKLDEKEAELALSVAINYETTNVYGPDLRIGKRDL